MSSSQLREVDGADSQRRCKLSYLAARKFIDVRAKGFGMQCAQHMLKHSAYVPVMQRAYASPMKISSARHLRRQANLALLVREAGGATALGVAARTPKSHVSAMHSGNRGVGDELAAKLERAMGKPPGWMDADHALEGLAPMHAATGTPSHVSPAEAAEAVVRKEIIKAGNAAAHGVSGLSPLMAAAAVFARYMIEADAMTREAITPLLERLTTAPEDAPRIGRMIEALIEQSRSVGPSLESSQPAEDEDSVTVEPSPTPASAPHATVAKPREPRTPSSFESNVRIEPVKKPRRSSDGS